jgi:uncharacterized protein (DUF2225 family)
MTRLRQIELQCPVCENRFHSQAVVSTNAFGGKRTDFHEHAAGTQPLPYFVHTCSHCGYTGADHDFTGEIEVTPLLREHVWSELAPVVCRASDGVDVGLGEVRGGREGGRVAGVRAALRGGPAAPGAWCCVDEDDVEAERYFRRKAAWTFEKALESWDGAAREERAVLTYLVGELWRRVGYQKLAGEWFARVPNEIIDEATQQWVADAAVQQCVAPREWFG